MNKNSKEKGTNLLPIFMCIGVGIGALVGYFIFDQIAIGMCFGIALGVFASAIFKKEN
ncbi:hypothetical protein SAMN04487886_108511 [Clostridium sp. DSM 8431]|uniref:hypothetical protein n=1 Tax=Clostridium sp. DSM 8431 TaxID=1761781 RepID=UPI0008ED50E4|nr:hypothetical protein [Clostridium sp. DSM 8431]SFU64375.1 hypothetical protein SAMN04487886_108511 [Clostridium sp. DSM 8431]